MALQKEKNLHGIEVPLSATAALTKMAVQSAVKC